MIYINVGISIRQFVQKAEKLIKNEVVYGLFNEWSAMRLCIVPRCVKASHFIYPFLPKTTHPKTILSRVSIRVARNCALVYFSLCLLIMFITGCAKKEQHALKEQPLYGGTLKTYFISPVENLDPHRIIYMEDWETASCIYEGLVGYSENFGELTPLLANSWQRLDDGRRWIFGLNRNVYFHNDPCFPLGKGRRLIADDIKYSFERLAHPKTQCNNWYLFAGKIQGIDDYHNGLSESISGIRIIDDCHIEFQLTKPYVTFLKLLTTPTAYIMPKEAVDFYQENFVHHPVGTGPFRLVRWKPLEELILIRNENYWQRDQYGRNLPYLEIVEFRIIPNPALGVTEFLKGEIQLITVTDQNYQHLLQNQQLSQQYKIAATFPGITTRFLGISMDKDSPLSRETEIRRALVMVFNRSRLVANIQNPALKPSQSFVPPSYFPDQNFQWHNYNYSEGMSIAQRYRNIMQQQSIEICTNVDFEEIQMIKESVHDLGLSPQIVIQSTRYYEYIIKERPDIFRVSFYPSFPDPEEYYAHFYSRSDPTINLTAFKNAEYDNCFEQAMIEYDNTAREKLYLRMEQILSKEIPAIYLHHSTDQYFITPESIHGLKVRAGNVDFREVWMEQ